MDPRVHLTGASLVGWLELEWTQARSSQDVLCQDYLVGMAVAGVDQGPGGILGQP